MSALVQSAPSPLFRTLAPWVAPLALVAAWEGLSRSGVVPPTLLPAPSEVVQAAVSALTKGSLRQLADDAGTLGALRAETACRLWRDGYFKHAIVSGGITPGGDESECVVIKRAMVAGGIPAGLILEEHQATNTGENVIFSLPVIEAALGLANIKRVICLGNTWTARRYPMTLHRHWPDVEKMLVTVDSFATPRARWP